MRTSLSLSLSKTNHQKLIIKKAAYISFPKSGTTSSRMRYLPHRRIQNRDKRTQENSEKLKQKRGFKGGSKVATGEFVLFPPKMT
jgi:hypothetical protein